MDNDLYGHINNVVYYSFFDTIINYYLIEEGGLDIHGGPVIGIAAESFCRFRRELAYPHPVEACLRVGHLGKSSVRYEVGLFKADDEVAAAAGYFVHVFCDRITLRPSPISPSLRAALERLQLSGS
jgi:acyl-CoA thioester hydrolase